MTKTEVMKELRANGSAQTRKISRRHGIKGDMFGVSYAFLGKMKRKIKTGIHGSENWVRYAMNNALINIGVRNAKLEKIAIAAAGRIGTVEVDHGETGCKTPEAVAYIKKTVAYNKKKTAKKRRLAVTALIAILPATLGAQMVLERIEEAVPVAGVVFLDRNANGVRDAGEPGIEGVVVSDQVQVVTTDRDGRYSLSAHGYGLVFVSQPDGYASVGPFWRRADPAGTDFGLTTRQTSSTFTFVHASDTHLSEASVDRLALVREMVDSLQPAFVLITGDLIRDALRVSEEEARGYYELLERELEQFTVPVFTVPGNHEKFGIERHLSLVAPTHPLYGNRMYRHYRGPNYYSFTWGGVHFLGLDTVDYDDLRYHGHVDSLQVEWIGADVAALPPEMPVVIFNHIPLIGAGEIRSGLVEDGAAPSIIRIDGRAYFRHSVYNHQAVLGPLQGRLELALQGHIHIREVLKYRTQIGEQRLITAAAVVGPAPGRSNPYGPLSGITLHRVVDGRVDDGTFLPLDPRPSGR